MRHHTLLVLSALFLLQGCSGLRYLVGAANGQADINSRERPIGEVLADPRSPEWLTKKLRAVVEIREFATRELHLPEGGSYRSYADLERPYVVWNVFAAPEFSTVPHQWCFPVAGCVAYRGYFSEESARRLAESLKGQGFDVHVSGVPAYSTLGWFEDPVLSTFVHYRERDLARLILHELAHRVVYVKDDSTFNESFATTVEIEGARRWLVASGRSEEVRELDASAARTREFRQLVGAWRHRLDELYRAEGSSEAKQLRKRRAFEELRRSYQDLRNAWGGYGGYDEWFSGDLNNARLASVGVYSDLVPALQELLRREGGDLACFFEAVRSLGRLSREARAERLRELTAPEGREAAARVCGRNREESFDPAPGATAWSAAQADEEDKDCAGRRRR